MSSPSAAAGRVLCACALLGAFGPSSAAVLDVTAFGADSAGKRTSHAEISKAVAAAKAGDVVFFPQGVYLLGRTVGVVGKKGVILRGAPGAVVRMHCNPCGAESESSGGFCFRRCEDAALEGVTLTTDNPIGCVGRVTAVDQKARTVDLLVDEPFPATGEEHFFQLDTCDEDGAPDGALEVHRAIAPRTNEAGRVVHEGLSYRMAGPRLARISVPKWAPMGAVTNGHRLLVRYFRNGSGALVLDGVKRMRVENVEVERTPSTGCVVLPPSEDVTFRRFSIRMRADDPNVCASNSDGIHFVGCAGSVTLEDCHFKGLGDDALNVHSLGAEVKAFDPATGAYAFVRRGIDRAEKTLSPFWAAAGDAVAVYDPTTLAKRGTVTLATWNAGTGTVARGGVALRPGDLLANARNYPVVRLSNCTVENTRARAFLLQSADVLVENCRFRGLKSAALLLACDMVFWHEMGPFERAVVRNCTFEKCVRAPYGGGLGALVVRAKHDGGPSDYPAGVHRNLTVVGNTFDDVGASAVYVEATEGIEIRDNVFGKCAAHSRPTQGRRRPVRLHNCAGARVTDGTAEEDCTKGKVK